MAEAIRLGRMTDTMEEGFVAEINIKVGDKVKTGDSIADIETDKATLPLESYYNGTVLHVAAKKGDSLQIGALIAVVGKEGEDFSALLNEAAPVAPAVQQTAAKAEAPVAETESKAQPAEAAVLSGTEARLKASPLARAIAKEKGIDLSRVNGTGEDGRIVKRDLEQIGSLVRTVPQAQGAESYTDLRVSQMRKTIAKRLLQSKNNNPHFYLTADINMDRATALRNELNSLLPAKVSFNDFVIKAAALALRQHPAVNASWMGETIRQYHHIHIGMAVAVDEGLVVPVIKFADAKPLSGLSQETKACGEKARDKKLLPQDMEGSTFSISNLGMFGIEDFTAIINEPNACILAVGAIRQTPVAAGGEIKIANMMKVTLSSDHRVVDGAVGARFVQTLKQLLEEPLRLLL